MVSMTGGGGSVARYTEETPGRVLVLEKPVIHQKGQTPMGHENVGGGGMAKG